MGKQRAVDDMMAATKEDMLQVCANVFFGEKSKAQEEVPKLCEKFFPPIEQMLPEEGFFHGLKFPTMADLALLNITRAKTPFSIIEMSGYDWETKFPRMKALVGRASEAPGIKNYLARSNTFNALPSSADYLR